MVKKISRKSPSMDLISHHIFKALLLSEVSILGVCAD